MPNLVDSIRANLAENSGKLSFPFIQSVAESGTTQYLHPTPNMRLCIISLSSGHEVLGMAQVLDAANDVETIGNQVAYDNAIGELWNVCGSIAKVIDQCK